MSSPILNLSRWPCFFFLNETFRTIRREFPQNANTMLNISIIFPYSAFPRGWNSHVLIQSQSLHLHRRDYPFLPTQWHCSSNFFPLPFKTSNLYPTELFTSALSCYFSQLKHNNKNLLTQFSHLPPFLFNKAPWGSCLCFIFNPFLPFPLNPV